MAVSAGLARVAVNPAANTPNIVDTIGIQFGRCIMTTGEMMASRFADFDKSGLAGFAVVAAGVKPSSRKPAAMRNASLRVCDQLHSASVLRCIGQNELVKSSNRDYILVVGSTNNGFSGAILGMV